MLLTLKVKKVRLSTIKVIEVAIKTVVFLRQTMIQMNTVRKNKKYCQWNKRHMQLFIHAMQKVDDEKASCKHSSGNFFIMEDNDLSQSLDWVCEILNVLVVYMNLTPCRENI